MRSLSVALTLALAHIVQVVSAMDTAAQPPSSFVPWSGEPTMPMTGVAPISVLATETVHVARAAWLRLHFDELPTWQALRGGARIDADVQLKITSAEDGAIQYLDARAFREWAGTSAYFNGDTVTIELLGNAVMPRLRFAADVRDTAPSTVFRVRQVEAGTFISELATTETVCHRIDQRSLSYFRRAARMMPIGCTGWLIDDAKHCFLTAGHCAPASSRVPGVVEFQVPMSRPDGTVRHPLPEDQYPVDPESIQVTDEVESGNDWMYFGAFPNSNTKKTAFQVQKDAYTLTKNITMTPALGTTLSVVGYGLTNKRNPVDGVKSQVQQIHAGPLTAASKTGDDRWLVRYQVDTMGGNSGSAILNEATKEAIGIHTNGGCYAGAPGQNDGDEVRGANFGTFLGNVKLQAALAKPRGVCK